MSPSASLGHPPSRTSQWSGEQQGRRETRHRRVIQRRARPRPNDCTLPAAASASSARCTVRWLTPSASARAELDHDSPSARKASAAACRSSTGRASTTTSPGRHGARANPRFVALTPAIFRSTVRSRPISTRKRARCDHRQASLGMPARPAWPSAHLRAKLRPAPEQHEQHRAPLERDHRPASRTT